ncbi:MAG TPA: SDR family oxidoreductase [Acidimicrobiia bacterium]|nr:SDR family oxidoreductase [Acidimicrobiia bacterium]
MLLEGKIAIVSGIGPGMGRDISLALATEGADLVLAARTKERLDEVAEEVRALDRRVLCVPTDITDDAQCTALVEAAVAEYGRLDTLVNNAFAQPPFETVEATSMETFRDYFDVNFFGHVALTKAAIPYLKEAGTASIVFINSMSAWRMRPFFGIYTSAKLALHGLAKILAVELGEHGIRVNSVHPGYIWGESVKWFFENQAEERGLSFDEVYEETASQTPLHHLPGSDEIAQSVVFLASDKMSSSITGVSIDVNAGQYMR